MVGGLLPGTSSTQVAEDELQVTFRGEALGQINQLALELQGVENSADVITKGLTILLLARGREIILRDKQSGESMAVDLWK